MAMGAVGLRSLGLTDLGGGLCKRNSVLNVALAENYPNHTTTGVSRRLQAQFYTSLIFAEPDVKVDGTYPTIKDGDIACLSTALLVTCAR